MIIWTGRGYAVAVIVFLCALGAQLGFDRVYQHGYYSSHGWAVGVALASAGVITVLLSPVLDRRPRHVDAATGRPVRGRSRDTLFWIPCVYWGGLLLLGGLGLVVVNPAL